MRRSAAVFVLAVFLTWLGPASTPGHASGIPVIDVANLVESILQRIQLVIDEALQYQQLYHDITNLASLPERLWRDFEYAIGEHIHGQLHKLAGYSDGFQYEIEDGAIIPAYFWDDIDDIFRELYPRDPVDPYRLEDRESGTEAELEYENYFELLRLQQFGESELVARGVDVLHEQHVVTIDGLIALSEIRDQADSAEGAEQQGEVGLMFDSFQAEEASLSRQLLSVLTNALLVRLAREVSAESVVLSNWEQLFEYRSRTERRGGGEERYIRVGH